MDLAPFSPALPATGPDGFIPSMSQKALEIVRSMEAVVRDMPQEPFKLDEWLHAGMYLRMVTLPPGYWGGAEVKEGTILIVVGDALIYTGEDEPLRVSGVTPIRASAGRKQAFFTEQTVTLIMVAATAAGTTADAVRFLCAEPHTLREGC